MRIFGMGTPELLVIGIICLVLFGTKRLPELGKTVGVTIKELKKGLKEGLADEPAPGTKEQK
ncbi:MAG: twin-arginine translocase TatA/TatE family subunit [Elusimicrobia bacterium]|nr:twin-arginine translocase TatA/TatE family subunit [Elusimicrobiota bacterium]